MKRDLKNRVPPPDLPFDPELPGLSSMVDTDFIKSSLYERFKSAEFSINRCDVSYIRYKPGTNCIIVYEIILDRETGYEITRFPIYVKLLSNDEFESTAEKARHHRWVNLAGTGDYMLFSEHNAILYFFPNDPVIDGLRILANPKKIQRILYQYYSRYPERNWRISDRRLKVSIMRFKPERRAVIRLDTRAVNRSEDTRESLSIYARFYADDSGERSSEIQRQLYQMSLNEKYLKIAQPIAYLPDRRMLLMESLKGNTLQECIKSGDISALGTAAKSLAVLHRLSPGNLTIMELVSLESKIAETLNMISYICPELSEIANEISQSLKRQLGNGQTSQAGFVHGDLHPGQIIIDGDKAGIIDFDRSYLGDSTADIGNFIANLRLRGLPDNKNTEKMESEFISAYEKFAGAAAGKEGLSFWIAFSLFQLAVSPFRSLEPNWRDKISQILTVCHTHLK